MARGARGVSNLVSTLVLIGVTLAAGVVVSRFMMGGVVSSYDRPAHAQITSKYAMMIASRVMRLEVVVNNPTGYPFCVRVSRVAVYTSSTSPAETVNISNPPSIVVAPGSSSKYEVILQTAGTYSSGVVSVAYIDFFVCQTPQGCTCSGTPAYTEAVFVKVF